MLRFENIYVADGTGAEPFRATVLTEHGSIVAVERGKIAGIPSGATVNGRGLILSPGFIDAHGHSDVSLMAFPEAENKVAQGITTEIAGNCGLSAFPVTDANRVHLAALYADYRQNIDWDDYASYRRRLREKHPHMRLSCLCGHNTLRAAAAGYETRRLSSNRKMEMEKLLGDALNVGARGLSSGLQYVPGKFSDQDELQSLLRIVSASDGVYATHLRSEGTNLLESLAETLECAGKAGVKKVLISHFKTAGRNNWSKLSDAIRLIEYARDSGIEVTVDRYPYLESMTQLSMILPPPWDDLGDAELQKRLHDRRGFARMESVLRRSRPPEYWADIRLAATAVPRYAGQCGKRFSELNEDPVRAAMELLADGAVSSCAAFGIMNENNLKKILALDYCMPGSDASALPLNGSTGCTHPRAFGAIARFMRLRLDDSGSIGDAVRRATSLPAGFFSLHDRGVITPGRAADLVIFDPDSIDSSADFRSPCKNPSGIMMTVMGGDIVFRA